MKVTSVRCGCLRGVWLGNTGPSLPRLLPNPLSAPPTQSYAPRRKHFGNIRRGCSSRTGNILTELSHVGVRELILNTHHSNGRNSNRRNLSSRILGGHTEDRMFRNICMTECSSPVSLSECTSRGAAVSVRDSRLGWNAGAPGLPASPHPPGSTSGWSET